MKCIPLEMENIIELMMASWGYTPLCAKQNGIVSSGLNLVFTGKIKNLCDEMTFIWTSRGDVPSINVSRIGMIINCIRLNLMAQFCVIVPVRQ